MELIAIKNVRDPDKDQMLSERSIQRRGNRQCVLDGCNRPLTHYKGPCSQRLCRDHQLMLKQYGGPSRIDRPWTFWKKDHCEECGHMPSRDNPKIAELGEAERSVVGMMMLHVDHVVANKTKNNHPDNLRTLCQECHMLKTWANGDHVKS